MEHIIGFYCGFPKLWSYDDIFCRFSTVISQCFSQNHLRKIITLAIFTPAICVCKSVKKVLNGRRRRILQQEKAKNDKAIVTLSKFTYSFCRG